MDFYLQILYDKFPNLEGDAEITSPIDKKYNCIAWAYGDSTKWYWPGSGFNDFWPNGITREETLEAFIELFELIGYRICDNDELEEGLEKVAIYMDVKNKPSHAAR